MKILCAVLLTILGLPAASANAADCKAEFATVLAAMRSGGPMRREDVVTKDGAVVEKMVLDLSPPDQMKEVSETVGFGAFKMFVSGKKAWTISTTNGRVGPVKEQDAGFAKSVLESALGLEETNAPLVDCAQDGNGTIKLTWKGEDDRKSVLNVAIVDAKTHLVKTLNRSTLDTSDNTKYGRNSTYTAIPAFTVDAPAP
ncbi:MAG: hypothetical protein IPL88_11570 [Rhizobiales bacterium]|nr:hypothetical protein [Hyphomicrobiales bacterium]